MSEYMRALRAKVGNDFILVPSVAALIRDEAGRVLLVRHVEGRWQIPGGAIDPGERPDEALRRECREEAGIDVKVGRVVGVYGGPEHTATYANGDRVGWIVSVFEATRVGGELRPDHEETDAVEWFEPGKLDELEMHAATRATLAAALRRS